ncbi:MAG: hypothetical protein JWM16_4140 [Verrucomicrobiales bacterium]|nr:hypothetical protein [Verrucomicrobiales bacterium]
MTKTARFFWSAIGWAAFLAATAEAATLYVSPDGNDQWTGRAPKPSGKDGPFATLPAALQAARKLKANEAVTIQMRGGTYSLTKPITLSAEDSGASAQTPLTISAYPGEKAILSGGRRITGWKKVQGDLWQVEIPEVKSGDWMFRSLFVNGERKQRARTPNTGFFRIQGASPKGNPAKVHFKPGDIKQEWADPGDVELIALIAWADLRMPIRAVDTETNVATLSGNARPSNQESNARYYIENVPDGLDTPGEWYLNRKNGMLRYLAEANQDLTKTEVIAPLLTNLLILRGSQAGKKAVQYVHLRNLTFSYSDWAMPAEGYADTQAAIATRGDLQAEFATDCAIEDCTFTQLSNYAIDLGRGCQRNRVIGNEIGYLGAGGIRIGETGVRTNAFESCHSQIITDNHIHHLGIVHPPAVGVLILQSGTNRVAYNHIHHLYYTAVSVGWNWGYRETPCRENAIEFNHMHDIGQNMLSDMGAVYTLGIQKGTVVRNNLIHDVSAFTYGGWGLYPDEGSTDTLWENNIVYHCKNAGFHQHYGKENIVRNNIFAFNKENQVMRTRPEPHISFIFTNNIVYHDSGNLLGSDWSNDHYTMDYNVYFDTRIGAKPEAMKFAGARLEQWRQRGHDEHSIIADPDFVNPQAFDFGLKPGSPALKLGFKPIDPSRIGIRDKSKR